MDTPEDGVVSRAPRPGNFARLLLAAGDDPPRQRARDQQADHAGAALRRCALNRLAALDPEPDELEAALLRIVAEFGEPTGPTRGVCTLILQEWEAARRNEAYWGFLIREALRGPEPHRGARRGNGDAP